MVRAARKAAKLTQGEVAKALGLGGHYEVSRIEDGTRDISPEEFARLLGILQSLDAVELINAMGYPVLVRREDSPVPNGLARIYRQLSHEDRQQVVRLARGLLATSGSQQERT